MASVLDAAAEPANENFPFQDIKTGHITLRGHLAVGPIQRTILQLEGEEEVDTTWIIGPVQHTPGNDTHEFVPDTEAALSREEAWCMPIGRIEHRLEEYDLSEERRRTWKREQHDIVAGLVLVPIDEVNTSFRRIGLFHGPAVAYQWLLKAEEQAIVVL